MKNLNLLFNLLLFPFLFLIRFVLLKGQDEHSHWGRWKGGNIYIQPVFIVLLLAISPSTSQASTQLAYDQFTYNSADGYNKDDGWKNQLKVKGKEKSYKTYDFGSAYANTAIDITFKMKWKGSWENSGSEKDYFKVNFNNTQVVNDTFSGNASNWKQYSKSATTNSNGKIKIEFYANSTKNSKYIAIDDVKITTNSVPANQPPTADSQTISVDENSTNNAITLTGDDSDGDALTYTVVTTPSHGTLSGTAPNLIYTPTTDYNGTDSFTFKVNDGTDDSSDANVSITVSSQLPIIENANDLCYEEHTTSGMMCMDMRFCSGGMGCTNTYPLRNRGNAPLSNATVIYDESGMGGSFGSNCGISPSGSCQTEHDIDMGPIGLFGSATTFDFDNDIPVNNNNNSISSSNFMSMSCMGGDKLYATYIKNGSLYRGQVRSCDAPPPPLDESVPNDDSNATKVKCGTFADMFQTHGTCSGSSGGTIKFNNAGQLKDSSKNLILENNDNSLNTCQVTAEGWVSTQYETCGTQGDCVETGSSGGTLNINYNNPPATATVATNPSSSTNDLTLNADSTLSGYEYNNITTSSHTNISTGFNITNQIKINSLKMTNDNTFNFQSSNPYSLDIGTIGIVNNGSSNTITTDDNAKDININNFTLKSGTTLSLKAAQTLKMDTLSVGYGSNIYLKAQYVNINNFILDSTGSGDASITIVADYIDIGDFNINNHSDGATITIQPFTPGKRVLFRANTIEEGSNSTFIFYSGNYYVNTSISLPGTSDVSAMRAYDSNQLINLFINDNLSPGNNPGINSNGNNGNFGSNPAANFMMYINGDLSTGGGGTTFNATIYTEGDVTIGNPTYIKGAISANNLIEVGQGQFTFDQSIDDGGWGECSEGGSNLYITGPFDAWDTFRDNTSTPPTDRNISTKIVNEAFQLSLASLNKANDGYEVKAGAGSSIDVAIYPKNSNTPISNSISYDANTNAHVPSSANLTVTSAQRDAVVGFKLCATYENNTTLNEIIYTLHPVNECSGALNDCNASTSGSPTWHVCHSTDNFAIRPYAFRVFGGDSYNRAGENFTLDIKAVDDANYAINSGVVADVSGVADYNASLSDISLVSHFYKPSHNDLQTMYRNVKNDQTITASDATMSDTVASCPNPGIFTNNNPSQQFVDGNLTASLKFSETGVLAIDVNETVGHEFALVDADDTNITSSPSRLILGSSTILSRTDISKQSLLLVNPYSIDTTAKYNSSNSKNWLYMNDISNAQTSYTKPAMSAYLHYRVTARNKDGNITKNFTSTCFPDVTENDPAQATDCPKVNGLKLNTTYDFKLSATINTTAPVNLSLYNGDVNNNALYLDSSDQDVNLALGDNAVRKATMYPKQFANGVAESNVHFNVDRNNTTPLNPVVIKVKDVNTWLNWSSSASPADFNGSNINKSYNFIYGRTHAPRQRFSGNSGTAFIYYEGYCNGTDVNNNKCHKSLLPNGADSNSTDDPRWFNNAHHNSSIDGNAGTTATIIQKNGQSEVTTTSSNGANPEAAELQYHGSDYPYKTTMTNQASPWLIYNKYNAAATTNEFEVEFMSGHSDWAGQHETNATTDRNASNITNRRSMW